MQNNGMNGRQTFWADMSRRANEAQQTGEYLASEGLNGLFLGNWDEIEGFMGGLGYALGSLNSKWNTRHESMANAFRRGYANTRNNRRQVIDDGYREHPVAGTAMRTIGTIVSPGNSIIPISKTAPLGYKAANNFRNAILAGTINGYGDSKTNDVSEISYNVGNKIVQNLIGNRTANSMLGRAGEPLARNTISVMTGNGIDAFESYIRNKFNY